MSTPTRASDLPDVPTPAEAGFVNADTIVWYGVFMPSKTPRAIVDKFNAAAVKVLATPAMKEKLAQLGGEPLIVTPAEFGALMKSETDKWEKIVKFSGASVE